MTLIIAIDKLRTISNEISESYSRTLLEGGELLMSLVGYPGEVAIVPSSLAQANIARQAAYIKIAKTIHNKYVMYYLLSDLGKFFLFQKSTGSAQQVINLIELKDVNVILPPLAEQQKIAKILTTVDNLIEKTQALIDKYTAIKQGMMANLFTRGIDLSGTSDTNPNYGQLRPSYEQAPGLYKKTQLGWVPKDWGVQSLINVTTKVQDGTHFSPIVGGGDYLYLTSKNIRFGYLTLANIETISKDQHDLIYKRCDVVKGDILLTKDGANTGNAAINDIDEPFSMLSSVAFIRSNELSTEEYLLHYILSDVAQSRIKDSMSGNAITRLTLEKINNFLVPSPSVDEQEYIAERLCGLKSLIDNEQRYLDKLSIQKKGLMQDLLTGKVKVN